MTAFILIDPRDHSIRLHEALSWQDAARSIGLDPSAVDHTVLARSPKGHGFGLWVYEWGLMRPIVDRYFALNRQLLNGQAVLYAFDEKGETVNCPPHMADHIRDHHLSWYDSASEVEHAIEGNRIDRPQTTINGEVVWQWRAP